MLVSFDKIIVLMGVVYMPHAGRPVEERLDCLNTALRELHDLRSKYPNAWQILAGDFNAPDWLACDDGSGTVASSIRDGMPRDYVVLNCIAGKPQATHKLGNVLDAILTNRAQDVVSFTVGPLLPISDHCPLLATFKVPYSVPRPKGLWCTSRVFSSDAFCKEAQTALCQLYAWIGDECRRDSSEANLFNVLQLGSLLLSVTLLCHLFKLKSPYGRFAFRRFSMARPSWPRSIHRWVAALRHATGQEASRLRRKLRKAIHRVKRHTWRSNVSFQSPTNRAPAKFVLKSSFFQRLHRETVPWTEPQRSIVIGDDVLSDDTSLEMWASYLQSLTSWDGPESPEVLWSWFCGRSVPDISSSTRLPKPMVQHGKDWLLQCRQLPLHVKLDQVFTWTELCETLGEMNSEAASPQTEPLPSALLHCQCEEFRSLILVLMSLAWILAKCPDHWLCAVVIPILKPGKPQCLLTSYRPVSLLPMWYKIMDRLMFKRMWSLISARASPWQHGGIVGTDMAFALFHELVLLRRKAILPLETQFVFLDGQAAFCRPPALTVLDALLRVPGLHSQDLCVVHALLSNLRSRACITGELTRDWRNEAGLPQGGTLSVALFVLLTDAIYQRLVDAKVGLTFPTQHCSCPVLGYVDDLVLCVHSHEAIQDALTQVEHWTQNLRMALNVGRNKSALLMPLCPIESVHQVGSHPLPVVHQYRYLGGVVAHDGSVLPALQNIQSRSIVKTATLMRWCRSQSIPVPLIARLWVLYVESAVMPLLAALPLTNRHLNICDRMQRKMGRMLLGYQKRSPTPPVLLELAWVPWSVLIPCRRVGLLWRTLEQPHSLMTHLLPHSVSVTGSWGSLAMQDVQAIYGQPSFTPPTGWKTALRKHQDSLTDAARDSFLIQASMHSALLHYPVSVNCRWMLGAVNTPLNRLSSRSLASVICSRLFAGGQGLRGGDRSLDTPPTVNNCCLFCLQRLVKHAETLEHFLLHCPLQECSLQDVKPHLHRIMDDRQYFASMRVGDLRKLQDAMVASWQIRKMWLQGNGLKKPRSCMEFARANW